MGISVSVVLHLARHSQHSEVPCGLQDGILIPNSNEV